MFHGGELGSEDHKLKKHTVKTSLADIAVVETSGTGLPVLFIHGNSASKEVFHHQLSSPMGEAYRMIAFDLPGHGESSNAANPAATYTMPGYTKVIMEMLEQLGVDKAAVYGWSLGGHIAIELMPRFPGLVGLMLTGTPPVHPNPPSFMGGFNAHPAVPLIGKPDLTADDEAVFSSAIYGRAVSDEFLRAMRRADPIARPLVLQGAFDGSSSDQQTLIETATIPVAFVNGADDPIANVAYIGSLAYPTLWERHCFVLRGEGHAPFLTNPGVFNPILERFLRDMGQEASKRPSSATSRTAAA